MFRIDIIIWISIYMCFKNLWPRSYEIDGHGEYGRSTIKLEIQLDWTEPLLEHV